MAESRAVPRWGAWTIWIAAARPATLPAAVVPVIVGTAACRGLPRPLAFLAALAASLLIQIGTNFANDLFDYLKGADTPARLGPRRITQAGLASPAAVARATALAFGAAALLGIYLARVSGWPIIAIGTLAILCSLAYSGGPWPLGYHGLGDLAVFLFFGLVAVVGSAYVQTSTIIPRAAAAAVPVGFLVTAILVVNNLRDIDTDRAAGKRTLAVRLGRAGTRLEYAALVVGALAAPLALRAAGMVGAWFWLPWLAAPLAAALVRTIAHATDGPTLNRALKRTGQLHLLFGLLFAASLAA
ncbi:MAG: 1,4-dihydroxy-2-naphthoate polyprenyltransferase [Chloroflexi bacterium]|nr:1,4-dihydroxy-2-naphthoate polyprenyltransferase [Chloroflexota bacterium]